MHRMVGDVADGIASGVDTVILGLAGAAKGVGGSLSGVLDMPCSKIGLESPLRAVDTFLNAGIDAAVNLPTAGVIGSLRIMGHGIMNTMDKPLNLLGGGPGGKIANMFK